MSKPFLLPFLGENGWSNGRNRFWLKKWHTVRLGLFAILAIFWEWFKPCGPCLAKLRHLRFRRRVSFTAADSGRRRPDQIPNDVDGPSSRVLEDGDEDRMEVLPEELRRNVVKLSRESTAEGGVCDVYVVGTAHVSQESCEQVKAVIRISKPQVVFLELCPIRMPVLLTQNLKDTINYMVESLFIHHHCGQACFGKDTPFEFCNSAASMVCISTNRERYGGDVEDTARYIWNPVQLVSGQGMNVASKLEVCPGSEFRVACEEALKYDDNVQVKLGDRPVEITLRRTWAKMPLWHKTKLLYSLVFQAFFLPSSEDLIKMLKEMDDVDMLTHVIQDMSKQFPTLMETLVHERDQYMSAKLLEVAGKYSSVVAVVGKGHLQGIKKYWKQHVELEQLLHVDMPSRRPAISAAKLLTTVGVAAAGVAIISGIYLSTKK
ncbi:hypothetical protein RHMOL_Rhmol04G0081000 [Rhododendron molle]|uniref:Uncharacterized protein n=1 Tax=Rhododendron molle TaxID=49168 RepID=A0ACC0NZH7_RHOML|nr:hypothetical protein RHMOL_Rhmol04G0081000 [Rhododendron molle]